MPFKIDANGAIVIDAEKKLPIFIYKDGREAPFDADTTIDNIGRLNGEAKSHRERAENAEGRLKLFEGIEDGEAARKALETVKNIKDGELITAGKVQEIKDAAARTAQEAVANATRAAQEKEKQLTEQLNTRTSELNSHIIGGSFAGSKFIADKLAIPADMAQKFFGDRFKVDNGKLVPLDANGQPIFSTTNHGSYADFDEAIGVMVNQYPNKNMILKGSGASGGGSDGNKGGGGGGKKELSRAAFDALDPSGKASAMKEGAVITD